ncbi:MAG: neutral zinc metallopeptidase [Betaproteobacteria bacterium]
MKWGNERQSENVEDRRGMPMGGIGLAGGGIGTIVIVVLALIFGIDPRELLQQAPTSQSVPQSSGPSQGAAQNDPLKDFVSKVLADTEDTWQEIFHANGKTYVDPKLVLFTGAVQSACGYAQAAVGPFYCGADQKVYIDLAFYKDLRDRFKAPGDFAEAYVIAHEVGHHVQNLLGISEQVQAAQQRGSPEQAKALSVRVELQADCLAGVWANHADTSRHILESGDVEEGLNAASQIGDDRMQMRSRGYVSPESFTHGSGEQRVRWFKRGFESGKMGSCDTFKAAQL